jgi:FkbM family methyltransferase
MYAIRHTQNGTLVINPRDRFLGRCLELHRTFSPDEAGLLAHFIDADSVVVEAGANIGSLTVPMAMARPKRIYAFEPQRLVFQMLCANLVLNGITNVVARPQALGASYGHILVPDLDPEASQSFGSLELGQCREGEKVERITLDSLRLDSCALIKCDVEGMEAEVLAGAKETIAEHRPVLYIENDRPDHSEVLLDMVFGLGYRAFWHLPVLAPMARDEFGHMVSVNMLCIPRGREMALPLNEIHSSADRPTNERKAA